MSPQGVDSEFHLREKEANRGQLVRTARGLCGDGFYLASGINIVFTRNSLPSRLNQLLLIIACGMAGNGNRSVDQLGEIGLNLTRLHFEG